MKFSHLSASAIQQWSTCQAAWYGKMAGWPEQRNPSFARAAELGTAIHAAISAHHEGADPDVALLRVWERYLSVCGDVGADPHPLALGLSVSRLYTRTIVPEHGDRGDVRFSFPIPGVPIPVIGYVDVLAQGGALIREIKTTQSRKNWTQTDIDSTVQGTTYWIAAQSAGIREPRLIYSILRLHADAPEHAETTRTDEQVDEFHGLVRGIYPLMVAMHAGESRPTPTCPAGWCRHPERCAELGRAIPEKLGWSTGQ